MTDEVFRKAAVRANLSRMSASRAHPVVHIEYPDWVDSVVDWDKSYRSDQERMRLAIAVSRANVENATGGPFGAAIFEARSGRLVAIGMNSVVRLNNCTLHGETMAFMMAQQRVGSYTLNGPNMPAHELYTSCEPCAMCLGATLWSGVQRVVYGAARDDASLLNFEEGPVFPESYHYLEERGIRIDRNVLREEARAVLELYRARSGKIYNAR
jgi:tRNA(Arg) A34 adenosine deaminase TadA